MAGSAPIAGLGSGSLILQGAGVVAGVVGSYYEAKAQKSVMQMQADAARTNAVLADLTADNVTTIANLNADTTVALAAMNMGITRAVAGLNVSQISAISDFNTSLADGNFDLIMAKGDYQAAVAEGNAQFAEQNAQDALRAGQQKEQQSRLQYAGLKGHQRASMAANGVVLDEGSALRIQTDTDFLSDVDASTIHTSAVNAAMGFRVEAANQNASAAFARLNAKSDAMQTKMAAMGAKINAQGDINSIQMSASFDLLQQDLGAKVQAQNIKTAAASDAFNLRVGAGNYRGQAIGAQMGANGTSPLAAGATSLIGGAAQVASKWYSYSRAGAA